MKKIKIIAIVSLFCLFFASVKAQDCCQVPHREKDTSFVLPKLVDTSLFISDLKNKLNLRSVFESLSKKALLGAYMYAFDIDENGNLKSTVYYPQNFKDLIKVQNFVTNVFNDYKWEPGYKKGCITCKETISLRLSIFLNTNSNNVEVEIQDIETVKNIFYRLISYKDLKSFN